ncbi:tetratricopeptide repeat protein [candidate division GN15 bacterium]|nr:tetratricopeptide repeat protein [candidate division GN15 bacterium]
METFRLNSRLVDSDKEFVIQTAVDAQRQAVFSSVYINGELTEVSRFTHPTDIDQEQIVSLVRARHDEKKSELESMLESYRSALSDDDPVKPSRLAIGLFYKGYHREAIELFSHAVASDPDYHEAYCYLGRCHLILGDVPQAVAFLKQAVDRRPGFADYRCHLGEALLESGQHQAAMREFEEAIRINMYYADAYFNLGLAIGDFLRSSGAPAEPGQLMSRAADALRKASLIYPEYAQPSFDEALASLRSGDLSTATKLLRLVREKKSEEQMTEFAPFYMKYVLQPGGMSQRTLDDRIAYLRDHIKKNPTYVDLHAELSTAYLEQAKYALQQAHKQMKRTVELNPSLTRLAANLDRVEEEYENVCSLLGRVVEKG